MVRLRQKFKTMSKVSIAIWQLKMCSTVHNSFTYEPKNAFFLKNEKKNLQKFEMLLKWIIVSFLLTITRKYFRMTEDENFLNIKIGLSLCYHYLSQFQISLNIFRLKTDNSIEKKSEYLLSIDFKMSCNHCPKKHLDYSTILK